MGKRFEKMFFNAICFVMFFQVMLLLSLVCILPSDENCILLLYTHVNNIMLVNYKL